MAELINISMSLNENSMQLVFGHAFTDHSVQKLITSMRLGFDYYKYPQVEVVMDSLGGDARAMKALLEEVQLISKQKKQLTIVAGNQCASAAAIVLANGTWGTRRTKRDTLLLFHSPLAHLRAEQTLNRESGEVLVKVLSNIGANLLSQLVQNQCQQVGGADALLSHMRNRLDEVTQHWNAMSDKLFEVVNKKSDKPTATLQRLGSNLDRWSKLKNEEMKVKKLIELLNQRFDMDTLMDLREAYALCLIDKVDGLLPVSAPVAQARACMALCSDITSIPSPKG